MESARVRYLHTSCWHIRNRTSKRSGRVSFLIQYKYRTKHVSCCNLCILYLLRVSPSTSFSPLLRSKNYKFCFHSVWVQTLCRFFENLEKIFFVHNVYLVISQCFSCILFVSLPLLFLKSFSSQTFICLVKLCVVDNAYSRFASFKTFLASSFC